MPQATSPDTPFTIVLSLALPFPLVFTFIKKFLPFTYLSAPVLHLPLCVHVLLTENYSRQLLSCTEDADQVELSGSGSSSPMLTGQTTHG